MAIIMSIIMLFIIHTYVCRCEFRGVSQFCTAYNMLVLQYFSVVIATVCTLNLWINGLLGHFAN